MASGDSSTQPWLRRLRVTLGPVEEWKGSASGGNILQFDSDGTPNGLKVVCSIHKTIMGIPTPSTISIYNLSEATRNAIRRSLTKVTIEAGWDNTELHKAFQGSVVSVQSQRNGVDVVTKISALPGYGGLVKGVSSITFPPNSSVRSAVKDLASHMPGISVSDANLKSVDGLFGASGWSFAGSTKDALTQLANEYGFSWSVDDNSLRAVGDKASFGGIVVLNGKDGGLINVSAILQGPMQVQTGVKIKAIYVPGVQPGATVRIRSSLSGANDGDYRIHTANISLDCYSENWTMDLESFRHM